MKLGQISLTAIFGVVGLLFTASIGLAYNALTRSNDAVDRTSAVESEISAINVKLDYIKESIDRQNINLGLKIVRETSTDDL